MQLRSLYLQNFRRYGEAFFEFDPALNFIVGPNAQGKTTLLEAIHYLMLGRSFRPCRHQDLIQTGATNFYLEAHFSKHGVEQRLRLYADMKERRILHNETSLTTVTQLLGLIRGVVMTPDDLNLIKGSPADRRQFLDIQIAQIDPLYVHHLARYKRAMKQRNQLLKNKDVETIELWEEELAQAAGYITHVRKKAIAHLATFSANFYDYLTGEGEPFALHYRSVAMECHTPTEVKELYLKNYAKQRARELYIGHTLIGPHKDDLLFTIGGRDVRYFGSEGEQRSSTAALHIAAWEYLKIVSEDLPLWMVDDIGVSLDQKRREKLLTHLSKMGQLFLTTTEEKVVDHFQGFYKTFLLPDYLQIRV